jgi:hypothetical protein
MRATWIVVLSSCLVIAACSDSEEAKQESSMTGEDGGKDGLDIDPNNPSLDAGHGNTDVGKPDGGEDDDDDDTMTGCTAGREICGDGLDNDCDALADERCGCDEGAEQECYDGPKEQAGVGQCAFGTQACVASEEFSSWGSCEGAQLPAIELCNNALDDDCDGKSDETCVCDPGETRSCYGGSSATRGVGACQDGALTCVEAGDEGAWTEACDGEVLPETEACGNDVDEDCDGELDNGCACEAGASEPCYSGSEETRGVGACRDGMRTCELSEDLATWGGCTSDVIPSAEVCGNDVDEDCDGELNNDCAALVCPGDATVPASNPVLLTATGSGVTNYAFAVTAGPEGGPATATWSGASSTSPSAQLTPFIVGAYTVRVTAQNGAGDPLECSFTVTALPHGLRAQLFWDGTGDVDLHLHNANPTRWSMAPDDTFWQHLVSPWGGELDVDNLVMNGPENITVDNPVIGMTYTIAVHNWSNGVGRIATVNVFCGDTASTTPQQTWVSRALQGMEPGGQCNGNDFWRVARITFTSAATCTIETIDDYITAATSCTGL